MGYLKQKPSYCLLSLGQIMPEGWIKEQMKDDLVKGLIGSYDKINNTVSKNLFIKKACTSKNDDKEELTVKSWWSGEHEGYWKEAVIRLAFMTGVPEFKAISKQWMDEIINSTNEDGYIGIYGCSDRYNHDDENGELWTQSRIFAAMLAFYEFTKDSRVLEAVEKAVKLTISVYSDKGHFEAHKDYNGRNTGGISHAIGFFDILEHLYRITGDRLYSDYAVAFYKDYSAYPPRDHDLTVDNLLDMDKRFSSHGAHVSEGFYMPFAAYAYSREEIYRKASMNALNKLRYHLTPGGAMVSHESVFEEQGTGYSSYEYCTMAEFNISLPRCMEFSGDVSIGDIIEKMTFNAAQAARFQPVNIATGYLTRDNQLEITNQEREKYGATHKAAACCTLNAGRLMPYYVEGMWMLREDKPGIAALLYGPCRVETVIDGVKVTILEETSYPFSDTITFSIDTETPKEFCIALRIPGFSSGIEVDEIKGATIVNDNSLVEITKVWTKSDRIVVHFKFDICLVPSHDHEFFIQRGPIVFALPVETIIEQDQSFNDSGFYDYRISVADNRALERTNNYKIKPDSKFHLIKEGHGDMSNPWYKPPVSLAGLLADEDGNEVMMNFYPEGSLLLRRVTFPSK